ncbi:MAG TPA: pilus assembly protein N-terminal domain-containing protein [Myxococcota bacterium]|nr:pilus assembly protein N-terminal domain-containing protein [Myxococcota bacterium]HRY97065.1 pilus assembly protein N-terminal domain-containing protein [Myxococcota bacterium]HSA21454.1 pilus assembly protein N-terminal domain-containing protein [Myxococcota bacterium]
MKTQLLAAALAALCWCAGAARAEDKALEVTAGNDGLTIALKVGEQRTLVLKDANRVSIGDPAVADIKISGDGLAVFGLSPGTTTLLVASAKGKQTTYAVRVSDSLTRKTVFLKYADGIALQRLLRNYLSPAGRIDFEDRTRALVVVDTEPVVELVLRSVAELDQKPLQARITLTLVQADTAANPTPIPAELKPVVAQLQGVFTYNQWSVLDKAFITTEAGQKSKLQLGGEHRLTVELVPERIQGETKVIRLAFKMYRDKDTTLVQTSVELKDGELAVLGASRIDGVGKALITVVAAKLD